MLALKRTFRIVAFGAMAFVALAVSLMMGGGSKRADGPGFLMGVPHANADAPGGCGGGCGGSETISSGSNGNYSGITGSTNHDGCGCGSCAAGSDGSNGGSDGGSGSGCGCGSGGSSGGSGGCE